MRDAAWLSPDLDGPHEADLWGRIQADLARLGREVEVWHHGESDRRDAFAPGPLKVSAMDIKDAAETLAELIRDSAPLIAELVPSDHTNSFHCRECHQPQGGISRRFGVQPIQTDLEVLIERCEEYLLAVEAPDRPKRKERRPPSRSYQLHGACWAYRNHVARLVTIRPDLLPEAEGRRTKAVHDWDNLTPERKELLWRDTLVLRGVYEPDFVAAVRWGEDDEELETSANVRRDLSRHPYPDTPVWRKVSLDVRPDLRDRASETEARARNCWPVFVPKLDYDWDSPPVDS